MFALAATATVRDLVNHVVSGNFWVDELMAGKTIEEVGDRLDGDVLGEDPVAAYDASAQVAAAAFKAEGAMERPAAVSYGPVPGEVYCGHRFIDVLIHGWDLAASTGQEPYSLAIVARETVTDPSWQVESALPSEEGKSVMIIEGRNSRVRATLIPLDGSPHACIASGEDDLLPIGEVPGGEQHQRKVRTHRRGDRPEGAHSPRDLAAAHGVLAHDVRFFGREAARLEQNRVRRADLPDVVHLRCHDDVVKVASRQPELLTDLERERSHAVHMTQRVIVLRLDLVDEMDDLRISAAVELSERVSHGEGLRDGGERARSPPL